MEVLYYDKSIQEFIADLEHPTYAKTLRTIRLLGQFGHLLMMPHSKHLEEGLYELRIRGKQEVRLFYTFHKDQAIIIHGFVKKSQKTHVSELVLTRARIKSLTQR